MAASKGSQLLLIAAGSVATTWECRNDTRGVRFKPHGSLPIADITWNHNGQVIASCSATDTAVQVHENVILTSTASRTKLDSFQHNIYWKRPITGAATTSIAFGGKSRYLCLGDTSGAVCLWDLKKHARVRQFLHSGRSLQVALDPSDSKVLSLSSQALSVFHLREATLAAKLTPTSSSMSFSCFHMSPLESRIAAVGTNSGSLLLYDIHHSSAPLITLQHSDSHATITGLAFSPRNKQLLGATSSRGSLTFFDSGSGETIHQLASLDSAITSFAFHSDGVTCAVGTQTGLVQVYDLRNTDPLASYRVKDAVQCLRFAPASTKLQQILLPDSNASTTSETTLQDAVRHSKPPAQHHHDDDDETMDGSVEIVLKYSAGASTLGSPSVEPTEQVTTAAQPQSSANTMASSLPSQPTQMSQPEPQQQSPPTRQQRSPQQTTRPVETTPSLQAAEVQEIVQEAVDGLRDDMEEAIRNVHVDMIRQFQQQSEEASELIAKQLAVVERLMEENVRLRQENEWLKRIK